MVTGYQQGTGEAFVKKIVLIAVMALCVSGCAKDPTDHDIKVEVVPNSIDCRTADASLKVTVHNNSSNDLLRYAYDVDIKVKGHSDIVISERHETDRIIPAHGQDSHCLPAFAGYDAGTHTAAYAQNVYNLINGKTDGELEYSGMIASTFFKADE